MWQHACSHGLPNKAGPCNAGFPTAGGSAMSSDAFLSAVESKPATKGRIKTSHFFD
jgi:hypothetical protein